MLLEDLSLRMPGLEIRVSRDPKFEKNRRNDVFMHIIQLDSLLTTQMHFSPTHLVPLLLSTLFGGLASKLSLNPPSAAGPPGGRRGPQEVFFVGTPELLVGQLY